MKTTGATRERLLEAAMKLIWPHSYGAVSVDMICREAGVFKGSFYHFFSSKSELMAAALEHHWLTNQPHFDRIFAPVNPPVQRILRYFEHVRRKQIERKQQAGKILGCPYASIGAEVSLNDEVIANKIRELITRYTRYFERALEDANSSGELKTENPRAKAQELFAYLEGILTLARVQDDSKLLSDLPRGAMAILGIDEKAVA